MRLIENEDHKKYFSPGRGEAKYSVDEASGKTFEYRLHRKHWNSKDFPEFKNKKFPPTKEFIRVANSYGIDVKDLGRTHDRFGYDDNLLLTGEFEDMINFFATDIINNWAEALIVEDPYWEVLYRGKMI